MTYFELHMSGRPGKLLVRPDRLMDTVSAFADLDSCWIDEETPPGMPGVRLFRAPPALLAVAVETDFPVAA